jgi:hypothetical protein
MMISIGLNVYSAVGSRRRRSRHRRRIAEREDPGTRSILDRMREMPWEEARCLASSGDESAAAALYEQLGVPPPRHI